MFYILRLATKLLPLTLSSVSGIWVLICAYFRESVQELFLFLGKRLGVIRDFNANGEKR